MRRGGFKKKTGLGRNGFNSRSHFVRKPSKNERSKEITKLDRIFSKLVRLSSSDNKGICPCFTCSYKAHWTKMHCGHYKTRAHMGLRWDKHNAHPQCPKCNVTNNGMLCVYRRRLFEVYGAEVVDRLDQSAKEATKVSVTDLKRLRKVLSEQLKKKEDLL